MRAQLGLAYCFTQPRELLEEVALVDYGVPSRTQHYAIDHTLDRATFEPILVVDVEPQQIA